MRLNQVTVSCSDLDRSIRFYSNLGLKLIVRSEAYARFVCPNGDSTFSLHVAPSVPRGETCIYFECDSLDEQVARLKEKGMRFQSEPIDQPWLWRESYLEDPDGNRICLFHAGTNRLFPPWRLRESLSQEE